jgi:hypothetical protein
MLKKEIWIMGARSGTEIEFVGVSGADDAATDDLSTAKGDGFMGAKARGRPQLSVNAS